MQQPIDLATVRYSYWYDDKQKKWAVEVASPAGIETYFGKTIQEAINGALGGSVRGLVEHFEDFKPVKPRRKTKG